MVSYTSFIYGAKCVKPKRGACGVNKSTLILGKSG